MKPLMNLSLALCVAGLLACGKPEEPAPPKNASTEEATDCCKETETLLKDVAACCMARVKGGELSACCKKSDETPDKMGACCKKAKEAIGKMSDCCKKVLAGGKAEGCCEGMVK